MNLNEDYFTKLIELVEDSENAFEAGNYDEAAEFMEEARDTAIQCLEELERLGLDDEDE